MLELKDDSKNGLYKRFVLMKIKILVKSAKLTIYYISCSLFKGAIMLGRLSLRFLSIKPKTLAYWGE